MADKDVQVGKTCSSTTHNIYIGYVIEESKKIDRQARENGPAKATRCPKQWKEGSNWSSCRSWR